MDCKRVCDIGRRRLVASLCPPADGRRWPVVGLVLAVLRTMRRSLGDGFRKCSRRGLCWAGERDSAALVMGDMPRRIQPEISIY